MLGGDGDTTLSFETTQGCPNIDHSFPFLFLLIAGGILRRHMPVIMFMCYFPGNQTS
jgi:hypothetical protein